MERLTTRNSEGVPVYRKAHQCERCGETIWRLPDEGDGSPTTRLCEYEEAQGNISAVSCQEECDEDAQTLVEVGKINLKMSAIAILNNIIISAIFASVAIFFDKWWIILFSLLCHTYTKRGSEK